MTPQRSKTAPRNAGGANNQQGARATGNERALPTAAEQPSPPPAPLTVGAVPPPGFLPANAEGRRYTVHEVIGKGSYGTVCAATDNMTGERVAIKRISKVFDNVADAVRILREIKLLRLLRHPDVVQVRY